MVAEIHSTLSMVRIERGIGCVWVWPLWGHLGYFGAKTSRYIAVKTMGCCSGTPHSAFPKCGLLQHSHVFYFIAIGPISAEQCAVHCGEYPSEYLIEYPNEYPPGVLTRMCPTMAPSPPHRHEMYPKTHKCLVYAILVHMEALLKVLIWLQLTHCRYSLLEANSAFDGSC